jgi:hypothetical protein
MFCWRRVRPLAIQKQRHDYSYGEASEFYLLSKVQYDLVFLPIVELLIMATKHIIELGQIPGPTACHPISILRFDFCSISLTDLSQCEFKSNSKEYEELCESTILRKN